jgi:YD repeat-containing protein
VAEKDGVSSSESDGTHRPITYSVLDNLGEALRAYRFDGDGVNLSDFATDAATGAITTADASNVRALTVNSFDDKGRVFRSQAMNVDQTNGTIGLTDAQILALPNLATDSFYDHRGNAVAVFSPGGQVSKSGYDGADRLTSMFTTDGGAVNNANVQQKDWTHAASVSGDVVLEQTDSTYDGVGNVVLSAFKLRFDSDPTASTGALGSPTGGIGARVYYNANYYDPANRLTDAVNVGTNGGTTYTRPSSVPSRSDTVLVNHTDYDDAGNVAGTVDPRGIQNNSTYDLQGRKTKEDDGHSGPASSGESITDYT